MADVAEAAISSALEDPEKYKAELTFEKLVQNAEACPYRMPTEANSIKAMGKDEKTRQQIVDMASRFLHPDSIDLEKHLQTIMPDFVSQSAAYYPRGHTKNVRTISGIR